jgi:hypothetical protein
MQVAENVCLVSSAICRVFRLSSSMNLASMRTKNEWDLRMCSVPCILCQDHCHISVIHGRSQTNIART